MYALTVQAAVDSTISNLYMACPDSGSTQGAAVFDVSELGKKLKGSYVKEI